VKKKAFFSADFFGIVALIIVSLLMTIDLFLHVGKHITFDGHIHMSTMAHFASAIKDGEFPVTWSNNFANYGLPLPLFAHQLPAYMGALLILCGASVVGSYNFVMFLAIFFSVLTFYLFLKKYFKNNQALLLSILMNFFPYRIHNIYVRGALPEIMASIFYPLILLSIYQFNKEKKKNALILLVLSIFLLAITHPMMLLIFALPSLIYFFVTLEKKHWRQKIMIVSVAVGLALMMASYYLLPLLTEIRYFYQGVSKAEINQNEFLSLANFLSDRWPYFYAHPGPRGNFIQFGLIELVIVGLTAIFLLIEIFHNKFCQWQEFFKKHKFILSQFFLVIMAIMLMSKISQIFYSVIPGFAQLQYPWRFLVWVQFSVPFLFSFLLDKINFLKTKLFLFCFLVFLLIYRIPQLYGKNYVYLPEEKFYFNQANLHSQNFNTVWSANSQSYPIKTIQAAIVEGEGNLTIIESKNASRKYQLIANTQVKLVDYTFYFPGWQVLANGEELLIEFQDPNYRGLITYNLDPGEYSLELNYKTSSIRLMSQILSGLALVGFLFGIYFLYKKTEIN
jgi:hypothetical protein